jgi:hypothetical protein
MASHIFRTISTPLRPEGLSFEERWKREDKGLIISWEVGRQLAERKSELSVKALRGELPELPWKGGTDKESLKIKHKYGALHYLAEWQGLRGEDLDLDLEREYTLTCSRTGIDVTYTNDINKHTPSEGS